VQNFTRRLDFVIAWILQPLNLSNKNRVIPVGTELALVIDKSSKSNG